MEDLTLLKVNLVPKSTEALDEAARITGLSKTDCVNQAIQLYAFWKGVEADGGVFLREASPGAELEVVSLS